MRLLQQFQWFRERKKEDKRVGEVLAEAIITRRNKLYTEFLDLEKRKNDTKEHKTRLEELDWIIRGCK
jgi:hypothetical protein